MAPSTNKYNSVVDLLQRPLPGWIKHADDQYRVGAYDGYDDMYSNVPRTFEIIMRGEEDNPIYVPSAARIVEATNRYLGKDWRWTVRSLAADAEAATATDTSGAGPAEAARLALQAALENLFRREAMLSKFASLKRSMLKRGDGLLHITIDESKPTGARISISEINPRNYFAIPDPVDIEKTIGVYLVNLITVGTTQIARRIEYRRILDADQASEFGVPIGQVYTRMTFWEPGGWDDRFPDSGDLKPQPIPEVYAANVGLAPLLQGMPLPTTVSTIPVYLFRNKRSGGEPYGTSQIAGIETLIAGINQGASDEDITLALQGLGVYATTSQRPVDDDGNEVEWVISPATVLELKSVNDKFERVAGLTNMQPFQEHLNYLGTKLDEGTGLSPVAVGTVDASAASSGVALRLEMAPILAQNEEKELELLDGLDHMLHDLVFQWFPADGVAAPDPTDTTITNSFADPLPIDRAAVIKEITDLKTAGLISAEFAVDYLSKKLGFQFPADMLSQISTAADQAAQRAATELGVGAAVA